MPWKTMDVREQRVRFVVAALRSEQSLSSLCREFGGFSADREALARTLSVRRRGGDC